MKKKIAAALSSLICLSAFVSCGGTAFKVDENGGGESVSEKNENTEPTVGELIVPKEGDREYNLGNYRMGSQGVKLYYDDDVSDEFMLTLEKYFISLQNRDFDSYKETVFPDYAERYEEYLKKEYSYGLDHSFELNCDRLASAASADDGEEFGITRIKAEAIEPETDDSGNVESEEDIEKESLEYFDELFGIDYYSFVKENSDDIKCMNFYIYAKESDGEEHLIIGENRIVLAEKDGKYYTFG